MTNYERIKNMSVEEMANFFENLCECPPGCDIYSGYCLSNRCIDCQSKWLESEVDNNAE